MTKKSRQNLNVFRTKRAFEVNFFKRLLNEANKTLFSEGESPTLTKFKKYIPTPMFGKRMSALIAGNNSRSSIFEIITDRFN